MKNEMYISDTKLEKLAKRLSRQFAISKEEAYEIIYEEWDLVETLFGAHKKAKAVYEHLALELNDIYRIA
ncbi:MAG TPA: hypothetical protein ENK90_02250 [Epsilonproteobacteria bacterium]|uniref:hypothetical protein n=1 Tax=Sulfurovum sp. TaxID=1969726 RepID=UPI0017BCBD85|nr:hypothetical protein [Sulfurovum sp.]HHE05925.1 hypothetical protein [Campylobacterota bacterium]